MKLDRIECTATFQINEGYWFKVLWGGQIDPETEDAETETLKLKERLEEMSKKFGAAKTVTIKEAFPKEVQVQKKTHEEEVAYYLLLVSECTVIKSLYTYANTVQRLNEQVLFDAYNKKKKELQ